MKIRPAIILAPIAVVLGVGALVVATGDHTLAVLDPMGIVAAKQRDLMVFATALMAVVVLAVFALTFWIVWRFRAHKQAKYTPDWDHSRAAETLWWGIPLVLIVILSVVTWTSTHELEPTRPLASSAKPLKIQVVALQWKWLFIYPEQGIATVNYVQFPEDVPVQFDITSDAPMNSFWIPQLGGQIYAMSGMSTRLNLMADAPGTYGGVSANLSGEGFAGMRFTAESVDSQSFTAWTNMVRAKPGLLDLPAYQALSTPSQNVAPSSYASVAPGLYDDVVMKYMIPGLDEVSSTNGGGK